MKKICAFGDSVMRGIVQDCSHTTDTIKYMISNFSFAELCTKRLGLEIYNYARFGGTINQGISLVERYGNRVSDSNYCVVEYGGNDCSFRWNEVAENPDSAHKPLTLLDDFRKHYANLINRLKEKGANPVLLSLPLIDSTRYFKHISNGLNADNILNWLGGDVSYIDRWHEMYNMAVWGLGSQCGVPVIDITSPFLLRKDYRDYLCDDGIHPNEEGHRIIADAICDYASTLLW